MTLTIAVGALYTVGEELVPLEPEEPKPAAGEADGTGEEGEDLDEAMPQEPNEVDLWLERACTGIVDSMTYAHSINEPWLVMNAAICAWNRYLHLVKEARYADLHSLLLPVFHSLKKLDHPDPALLCSIAEALACAWEHKFYLKHSDPDVYSFKVPRVRQRLPG